MNTTSLTRFTQLLTALAVVPTAGHAAGKKDKADDRPNILFCIADDASFHHFGAAGCPWVNTPNFDQVASDGLFFNNCYTPNAKSAPSRACILTGRYSWQLKEAGNHICNFPAEFKVFTEVLGENGYNVAFTGKGWAPGNPGTIDGKPRLLTGKEYRKHQTTPPTSAISKNDYSANFADFLDENSSGEPWFFWFGCTEPHRAYEYGSGVLAGGKDPAMIDRVPSFWPDCDRVRNDMLDYGYEIEYFDSHIGRMLAELERRGMLDNTLVVVTSDNGMPFPRSKANNYEYSHHMPFAMMWKKGIAGPGRTVDDYVSFVDIAPTIIQIAGIEPSESGMQLIAGESLCDMFDGKIMLRRDHVLFGRERDDYGRPANQGYPIRGIMREGMVYINNMKPWLYPAGNPETGYLDIDGSPTKTAVLELMRGGVDDRYFQMSMGLRPMEELYDVITDIDCVNNLAYDPEYAVLKAALKSELYLWLTAQGDPRMRGNGDVFDKYPFDSPDKANFYERIITGEISEPWIQTRSWVNPSDYETGNVSY